jgi:hypothetical protein
MFALSQGEHAMNHNPFPICLLRRALAPYLAALAATCLFGAAGPAAAAIEDCLDASCRISTNDGSGSGCVFEISGGRVYVLTAAHVVGRQTEVRCEFWRQGHQSQPLPGRVIARVDDNRCDAAIVAVAQSQFGGLLPAVIPVAPRDFVLASGQPITSAGCAGGAWSTAWKGHVLGYSGPDLHFVPAPASGRSGSAIFDGEGRQIVGVLRARTVNNSEGIATSLQSLYAALGKGSAQGPAVVAPAARPLQRWLVPAQCPGGTCPAPWSPGRPRDTTPSQTAPAWPTAPLPAPAAASSAAAPIDLGPTNGRLDRIADLLQEMRGAAAQAKERLPAADELARQAAEAAKTEAVAARLETGKLREVVDRVLGDTTTIAERIEARRAKVRAELGETAGEAEIARAYARDLARERLSDGSLGWTLGKVVTGALGLSGPLALGIGGGLWLLSRRIGTKLSAGEPLVAQRLFDRVSDKLDELKDRIANQRAGNPPPA